MSEEGFGRALKIFIEHASYEGSASNSSDDCNGTNHTLEHEDHGGHANSGTVLFLFAAFAVGAFVRHVLKHTPIPYTVILIILGLAFGAASNVEALSFLQDFTGLARIDPHLMLYVFLPTLIFESAFVMDGHTFRKTIGQAMLLAGPGLFLCSFLTALMARYIFTYHWSWVTACMFGSILSATDPVAVVALLKDLGASKQLGTIIEGESLLNDGAAIVIFNVFLLELTPGESQTALQIFTYFVRVAFGGPAFGYLMAKVTIFWLSHVFNDALVEITITLASTYVTFYIGEAFFGVSGVLAVVTLGIELNSRRTNISPEVEAFLHRFWSMLGYLANTLIFILVGVVIAQRAFSDVQNIDWMFMVALYIGVMVIRFVVIGSFAPILTRIGYTIDWKQVIVITWGGLRGAVGLALALVVVQTPGVPLDTIGSKVLFHTAGIVILTLLVNATTIKYLLKALGMSDISNARRLTMSTAVRRVREAKMRAVSMLKSDRFLADANWDIVEQKTEITDPYHSEYDELEFTENSVVAASGVHSQCPRCEAEVPRVPHPRELAELAEEVRIRMIKAEKTSYWRQFEQGMLGRDAVLVLINLADSIMDTSERLMTVNDIAPFWKIPIVLTKIRQWIEKAINWKASNDVPAPSTQCYKLPYTIVTNSVFEWLLFGVILVNGVCTVTELSISNETGLQVLEYLNFVFCAIYIVEAVLKIIGLRQHYFRSKWNLFDLLILLVSVVDIIVELSLPESTSHFSPAVLRIVRVMRILRVGRVLRLMKLALPLLIQLVDTIINRRLRFGYDIGKGFVVGEEEMLQQFDRIGSVVHKSIARELRRRSEATRLDVIKSLGLMRKEHPGVALSVKTHQAIRSVLNHCRDTIKHLLEGGLLDETDAEKLFQVIEVKMKRLERTPASLPPPDPHVVLCNLSWLSGLEDHVVNTIQGFAELVQFEHEDVMIREGEEAKGIYIIVSGLVKVTMLADSSPTHHADPETEEALAMASDTDLSPLPPMISSLLNDLPPSYPKMDQMIMDYFGAGSVMGEMGILENKTCNATVECETDVQAFFICHEDLADIMARFSVVDDRLWRVSGIRIATQLLSQLPEYQDWPTSKLMLLCQGGYISTPPSEPAPTFEITDEHKEVVVVCGEVRCLNTRERLVAPCVVPRNVRYLLMNTGSPKLLVIPSGDSSENSEAGGAQDKLLLYRHKKQSLREKFVRFRTTTWQLLLKVYSWLVFLYRLCQCKGWRCPWRVRVGPGGGVDEGGEEQEGNDGDSTHHSIEMAESHGNPITSRSATRKLTPVTPMPPGVVDESAT